MKSIFLIIVLIITFSTHLFSQDLADTVEVNQLMAEGLDLLRKGLYDESYRKFDSSKRIAENASLWGLAYDSEIRVVESLWRQSKLNESEKHIEPLLRSILEKKGTGSIYEAHVYYQLGAIKLFQAQYDSAILNYNKSITIFEQFDKNQLSELAGAYANIGICYYSMKNLDKALYYYKKGMFYDKQIYGEKHPFIAEDLNNIGSIYLERNFLDEAEDYLLEAESMVAKESDFYHFLLHNLSIVSLKKGQKLKALKYSQRTLRSSQKLHGVKSLNSVKFYSSLTSVLIELESYDSATNLMKEAINIYDGLDFETFADEIQYVTLTIDLANLETEIGNYESAIKSLEELETHFKKNESHNLKYYQALINSSKGYAFFKSGKYEKSIKEYENAFTFFSREKGQLDNNHILITFQKGALPYMKLSLFDEALEKIQKAIEFNTRSWVSKNYDDLPPIDKVHDKYNFLFLLQNKIEILRQEYKKTNLISDLEGINIVFDSFDKVANLVRISFNNFHEKRGFQENVNELYQLAVSHYYEAYKKTKKPEYLEKCLYFSESNKSVLLSDILGSENAKKWSSLPNQLIQTEKENKADISYYQTLLNEEESKVDQPDSSKIELYQNKIFDLNNSLDSLLEIMENEHPDYYAIKYGDLTVELSEMQSKLNPKEKVIEYFLGDSISFAFILSNEDLEVLPLLGLTDIDSLVLDYRKSISDSRLSEVNELKKMNKISYQLYEKLFKPIEKYIDASDKLIIVPDASLGYIPFELLLKEPVSKDLAYTEYPYLIKNFNISYAYSANLLLRAKSQKKSGDEYLGFAPSYDVDNQETVATRSAELGKFRNAFVSLKWNQEEAENISKYQSGNTKLGELATETSFKKNAGNAKILHLAMHAFVDDDEPMNSKLVFYQDNDSIEDGYLHTYELFNMDLKADLAVLSACETGYGKLVKGEGIMSLARGFSYAGVPSVVMSHWQVDDQSTSQLMEYFYQSLSEGKTKSESLRQAKLKYLAEASLNKKHPFFWGAFVVIGDDSFITKSNNWLLYAGLLIISLIALLVIFRKKIF